MASVKTKSVDTSTTNPAEFLAGAPVAPAPAAAIPPSGPPAITPGTIESVNSLPTPPAPVAAAPAPSADPARPGLETPVVPSPPDPFELLGKWITGDPQHGETYRNMRALTVPGGCIVRVTSIRGTNFCESICFVPDVKVQEGKLVADTAPL